MDDLSEEFEESDINMSLDYIEKKEIRDALLNEEIRPDGRNFDEIRELTSDVRYLPRVHGSAIFTRGETQIMNAVTLAPLSEAQKLDGFNPVKEKFFIHHYNFPPFSVGEPGRMMTGRREVGHGALAERAVLPVLPNIATPWQPFSIKFSACLIVFFTSKAKFSSNTERVEAR